MSAARNVVVVNGVEIAPPETPSVTLALLAMARELVIESASDAANAAALRKEAKAGRAVVVDLYAKPKRSLDDAKRTVLDAEKRDVRPYDETVEIIDSKLVAWQRKEAERVAEQNRRAREEAERQRAQLVAEEEERRQSAALALEAAGRTTEAEAIIDAPIVEPPIAPILTEPARAPKIEGVSMRTTWDAEVDSLAALAAWAIQSSRLDLVSPNLVALRRMATEAKREDAAPPGVRFVARSSVASRGGTM